MTIHDPPIGHLREDLILRLRQEPRVFEFLHAGCFDYLWYRDLEHPRGEWLSPRFHELLGSASLEGPATSEWLQARVHPDDRHLASESFRAHVADPSLPYDHVARYRHRDGSIRWLRCRGLALRDERGQAVRMLIAHDDVTAWKAAEAREQELREELAESAQEAETAKRRLNEFTYLASHDLRAPLRGIRHMTSWLADDLTPLLTEEQRHSFELVRSRVARMESMIESLLEYSRLERDASPPEQVTLLDAMHAALRQCSPPETCEVQLSAEAPTVHAPHSVVVLALVQLIRNAIEHHDRAVQRVTVTAERSGAEVVLCVADDGPGIPADKIEHAFQPFQTLQSRDVAEGCGIGLALVRRAVEGVGGTVALLPSEGRGATFAVRFPDPRA